MSNSFNHRMKTTSNAILTSDQIPTSLFESVLMAASNPSVHGVTPELVPSNCSNTLTHNAVYDTNKGLYDLFDLPTDAFEPVPIRENNSRRSSLDATLLEKVLDHALGVVDEPLALPPINNVRKQTHAFQPSMTAAPTPKRRRISPNAEPRFRGYQETQWVEQFNELLKFKEQEGNCLVPHTYPDNQVLSRWVKRQRYQYKLKMAGKVSTMTDARIKKLEDIGFVWDSHASAWDKRFKELQQYHSVHGDCNVPSNYPENQELATWIKCQRRQYKLYFDENKSSSMTVDRMNALNELGFIWKVRQEDLPVAPWQGVLNNPTNIMM